MVELKRGLNYIIGDKAYTPEQLLNLLRRACLVLFFVGLPVAFAGGIAFSKIFLPIFEPRPFIVMQQTEEDGFILPKPSVSHEYIKQACSTYLLDAYQNNSTNPEKKLIPKVIDVDGFAFSQKDIWCAAQLEEAVFLLNKGNSINHFTSWFQLKEPHGLELNEVSQSDFEQALSAYQRLPGDDSGK